MVSLMVSLMISLCEAKLRDLRDAWKCGSPSTVQCYMYIRAWMAMNCDIMSSFLNLTSPLNSLLRADGSPEQSR